MPRRGQAGSWHRSVAASQLPVSLWPSGAEVVRRRSSAAAAAMSCRPPAAGDGAGRWRRPAGARRRAAASPEWRPRRPDAAAEGGGRDAEARGRPGASLGMERAAQRPSADRPCDARGSPRRQSVRCLGYASSLRRWPQRCQDSGEVVWVKDLSDASRRQEALDDDQDPFIVVVVLRLRIVVGIVVDTIEIRIGEEADLRRCRVQDGVLDRVLKVLGRSRRFEGFVPDREGREACEAPPTAAADAHEKQVASLTATALGRTAPAPWARPCRCSCSDLVPIDAELRQGQTPTAAPELLGGVRHDVHTACCFGAATEAVGVDPLRLVEPELCDASDVVGPVDCSAADASQHARHLAQAEDVVEPSGTWQELLRHRVVDGDGGPGQDGEEVGVAGSEAREDVEVPQQPRTQLGIGLCGVHGGDELDVLYNFLDAKLVAVHPAAGVDQLPEQFGRGRYLRHVHVVDEVDNAPRVPRA
eukprot:scaffold3349_cov246-Pinguiococcus_pyrenoidosus.AAC.12